MTALRTLSIPLVYDCMDPVIEVIRSGIGPGPLFYTLKPWLILSYFIIDRSVSATLSVSPGLDNILRHRGWRGPILRFITSMAPGSSAKGVEAAFGLTTGKMLLSLFMRADCSPDSEDLKIRFGRLRSRARRVQTSVS